MGVLKIVSAIWKASQFASKKKGIPSARKSHPYLENHMRDMTIARKME